MTDQTGETGQWVTFQEGIDAAAMKRGTFSYYVSVGRIRSIPGKSERDHRYSLDDILRLKAERKPRRVRKPYIVDWMKIDDLPAAIALDLQVYQNDEGELVSEIGDFNLYRSWIKRNPRIAVCAFDKNDRRTIWAYVALVPLPERTIWDILTGKRQENDIKPEDIRAYPGQAGYEQDGGGYSLLAISAVALPGRGALLAPIFEHFMTFFTGLSPECSIEKIYAEAVTPSGNVLMQKLYFSSLAIWENGQARYIPNIGMLDLTRPGATKTIRAYQNLLERKGAHRDAQETILPVSIAEPIAATPRAQPARKSPLRAAMGSSRAGPSGDSDVPPGLVVWRQFADRHGIAQSSVQGAIQDGRLPVVRNEEGWKHGRGRPKEALDQNGRAIFYAIFRDRSSFVPCPDCPHEPGQSGEISLS